MSAHYRHACSKFVHGVAEGRINLISEILMSYLRRPYFSTYPTFKNPLKNPTSYLVETGFKS